MPVDRHLDADQRAVFEPHRLLDQSIRDGVAELVGVAGKDEFGGTQPAGAVIRPYAGRGDGTGVLDGMEGCVHVDLLEGFELGRCEEGDGARD
jgi:hypothetical protein